MLAQRLHDRFALASAHLQHHAQLFAKQCLERQLVAASAHLARPVFGVARVHAAVADAVALQQQHVNVERHTDVACKGHLAHCRQQAAVAAVVVGQHLALST